MTSLNQLRKRDPKDRMDRKDRRERIVPSRCLLSVSADVLKGVDEFQVDVYFVCLWFWMSESFCWSCTVPLCLNFGLCRGKCVGGACKFFCEVFSKISCRCDEGNWNLLSLTFFPSWNFFLDFGIFSSAHWNVVLLFQWYALVLLCRKFYHFTPLNVGFHLS